MDERTKDHTHARREGMRSQARTTRFTPVRAEAPLPERAGRFYYGSAPMKDLKSRIVTFSLAILVSLAAWGGFVYVAMHFLKK
jgi:hypothetical protein